MVVQMGERQTEDLDVAGSSPAHGITIFKIISFYMFILGISFKKGIKLKNGDVFKLVIR